MCVGILRDIAGREWEDPKQVWYVQAVCPNRVVRIAAICDAIWVVGTATLAMIFLSIAGVQVYWSGFATFVVVLLTLYRILDMGLISIWRLATCTDLYEADLVVHTPAAEKDIKVVVLADTHNQHERMAIPPGVGLLIHCGDFTDAGFTRQGYTDFNAWLGKIAVTHGLRKQDIVVIPGNHDVLLDEQNLMHGGSATPEEMVDLMDNATVLINDTHTVHGLAIAGVSTGRYRWGMRGFHEDDADRRREIYKRVLGSAGRRVDILVTHNAPQRILATPGALSVALREFCVDRIGGGDPVLREVISTNRPRLHVFGHSHECRGSVVVEETLCVNAANVGWGWDRMFPPTVVHMVREEAGEEPSLTEECHPGHHTDQLE